MKTSLTLQQLADVLVNVNVYGKLDERVRAIKLSSREMTAGCVFIAVPGAMVDGRNYILPAIEAGAIAIIIEAKDLTEEQQNIVKSTKTPYLLVDNLSQQLGNLAAVVEGYPAQGLDMVGVTGTNGKTTICQMTAEIIHLIKGSCGQMGTLGNGLVGCLEPSINTTTEAITTHKYLSQMKQAGAKHVVMEVSSHGLAQGRVNGINFKVAVFTNLTRDHLDYHKNMEDYFTAKKQLFTNESLEFAVINADDEYGLRLLKDAKVKAKKIAYSCQSNPTLEGAEIWATVNAAKIEYKQQGIKFLVQAPWGEETLNLPFLGDFNISNSLAVLSILGCLELNWKKTIKNIVMQQPVAGRMEIFGGLEQPSVIVDYAHTPDALEKALKALRLHCKGDLWCVFGCGGDRDPGKRSMMAAIAEMHSDHLIITDDNPRNEDGNLIIADILTGLSRAGDAKVERDRAVAIKFALRKASQNDVILIAGKGHENYQLIRGVRLPHSDREYVKQQLLELTP